MNNQNDLTNVSTDRLFHELNMRSLNGEHFAHCIFTDPDLDDALSRAGITLNESQRDAFWRTCGKAFCDRMTEDGWEMLDILVAIFDPDDMEG